MAATEPESMVSWVLARLKQAHPVLPDFLHYGNAFELLISVILSAQTTDAQVNKITPGLFVAYPNATSLSQAPTENVEIFIKSTGYYRIKTERIIGAAKRLVEAFGGEVPGTMDELVTIPGVGRKSAGVILHHIYGQPAIIVDTHFGRVCRRLGLSANEDPVKLEADIAAITQPADWSSLSMLVNLHGREFCHARQPDCGACFLRERCPSVAA